MSNLEINILNRIKKKKFGAFTSSDFLDLAKYKSISKALETLEDNEIIIRALRGVYYLKRVDEELDIIEAPDINEIALAISREYNWNIVPSENLSLNILGLSTQVPSSYIYVSDGPYREYTLNNIKITFKHQTTRLVSNLNKRILIVIQAIKVIGKDNINDDVRNKINSFLTTKDKVEVLKKGKYITSWIYETLYSIIKE